MIKRFFKKKQQAAEPSTVKFASRLVEVRLPTYSLEIGMHVTRLDRPWTDVPVLLQGLIIESDDDLDILREHCEYVYVELQKAFWEEGVEASAKVHENIRSGEYPGFRTSVDIHEELPKAHKTLEKTLKHVDHVLNDVANGEVFELEESKQVIKACVSSILSNANAMLWLTKIKRQDHYTAEHSMRVGILAIAFGRFIGVDENDLELLGLCGLLHDVGKVKIPDAILNKPGRLSREEYEIMKQHAAMGKEVLDGLSGVDQLIKDSAHFHHERVDGKGYPMQLDGSKLHKYIRMISIVDVYDAITSARPYKDGAPAFDALKILYSEVDKHFDKELVEAFIKMVGVYPPGTLVEMTNGEVGIVVSANSTSRLRPIVELVMTAAKKLRPPYVVDLSNDALDAAGQPYAIKEGLGNRTYGIDVKDYILK